MHTIAGIPVISYFVKMENNFHSTDYVDGLVNWMNKNWHLSVYCSILYVVLIFSIKHYMKNRKPFDLRTSLALWNTFLAVFSLIGSTKTIPVYINNLQTKGLVHVVCNNDFGYKSSGFWGYLFILSKLPEMIDTLFVVLRKKPLIFLHWYHHTTVLMYCWYSFHDLSSNGGTFVCMNYAVHTLMYSYYALKEFRVHIPKWCSKMITTLQLSQMGVGCFVNSYAYHLKNNNVPCQTTYENIGVSFLMYFTYFVLFFQFFRNAYMTTSGKSKSH
jgi:elongation of very long chain fatty acids protein 6